VGSATAGIDHVDVDAVIRAGAVFVHAPGANADSVADYVVAALLKLALESAEVLTGKRLLIVGAGEVGSRVARRAAALGLEIRLNDPPRERRGEPGDWVSLDEGLASTDIVSLHVPLLETGEDRTRHLIHSGRLDALRPGAWLLNTARGGVVDEQALLLRLVRSGDLCTVLDVWETEPRPALELIGRVSLATPHIAGYARESKTAASRAIQVALARFLGVEPPPDPVRPPLDLPPPEGAPQTLPGLRFLDRLTRLMYDIGLDDAALRALAGSDRVDGTEFEALRSGYPERHLFSRYRLPAAGVPEELLVQVQDALGVGLS
jgi:erythronate-4-phosphate dehydrogenase